jgi:DNA-binding NtrC family response regulator
MKTIAVIDDSQSMLTLMKIMLEKLGHKVFLFKEPLEAIKVLPILFCDLIIVDYMMFDMDGLDVIDSLKKLSVKTPMVLYTSLCDSDTKALCHEGNVQFVKKPLTSNDLEELCATYFK